MSDRSSWCILHHAVTHVTRSRPQQFSLDCQIEKASHRHISEGLSTPGASKGLHFAENASWLDVVGYLATFLFACGCHCASIWRCVWTDFLVRYWHASTEMAVDARLESYLLSTPLGCPPLVKSRHGCVFSFVKQSAFLPDQLSLDRSQSSRDEGDPTPLTGQNSRANRLFRTFPRRVFSWCAPVLSIWSCARRQQRKKRAMRRRN